MALLAVDAWLDVIRETAQQARKILKSPGESVQDIESRLELNVTSDGKKGVKVGGKVYVPPVPVGGVPVGGDFAGGFNSTSENEAIAKIVLTYRITLREEGAAKP